MSKKDVILAEAQEITLWQQLNKQLTEALGGQPNDNLFLYLKTFCLENLLFSKISKASLLNETPLALITNLVDLSFVALKSHEWTRYLSSRLRSAKPEHIVYVLDVDDALVDASEVIYKFDEEYHFIEDAGEEDADGELNEFIDDYIDMEETFHSDLSSIIYGLQELRLAFLTDVETEAKSPAYVLQQTDGLLLMKLSDKREKKIAKAIFKDKYVPLMIKVKDLTMKRIGHLQGLKDYLGRENQVSKQIGKFIKDETRSIEAESRVLGKLHHDFSKVTKSKNASFNKIAICKTSTFDFLKYPFPDVRLLK